LNETFKKVEKIDKKIMVEKYKQFYNWFVNRICYNANDVSTFMKLR